jgi:hypothetical protein
VPFDDFTGTADWGNVRYISIIIQSGGIVPSHDYAISSITVLPRCAASADAGPTASCIGAPRMP